MPYIRLRRVKHIRKGGVQKSYHPGDWVKVGKQAATLWLSDGSAEVPGPDASKMKVIKTLLGPGCGVRMWPKRTEVELESSFGNCLKALEFSSGPIALPYQYTMLWHPTARVTPQQVLIGFSQIAPQEHEQLSWEMVARLAGNKLARDVGSKIEQAKTEALIGDLRIPVYDTRVLWVRRTKATTGLVSQWTKSMEAGEDEAHAFLRVLYVAGILLCTLPAE